MASLLALAALLAGCAQRGLDVSRGGLAVDDSARLSLALAQVRAQAPADRVSGVPYGPRTEPEGGPEPDLALTGEGTALSRGFQAGQQSRLRLSLYLDKSSYARGYAKVSRDGGAEEVWRIVAYELRGQADKDFQFTYLLADAGGIVHPFMLLGGGYREGSADLMAIEGVLLLPEPQSHSKRYSPAEWQIAFPFAFLLKEPAVPLYQSLTDQAEHLFRDLDRDVPDLERLSQRLDALPAELPRAARNTASLAGTSAAQPADAGRSAAARAETEKQLQQRAALAQAKAVHYYQLRGEADTAFANYLGTNGYTWRDADRQQEAFSRWELLDTHADVLEDRVAHLLPFVPEPQKLEEARKSALSIVAKNKNATRRPAPVKN